MALLDDLLTAFATAFRRQLDPVIQEIRTMSDRLTKDIDALREEASALRTTVTAHEKARDEADMLLKNTIDTLSAKLQDGEGLADAVEAALSDLHATRETLTTPPPAPETTTGTTTTDATPISSTAAANAPGAGEISGAGLPNGGVAETSTNATTVNAGATADTLQAGEKPEEGTTIGVGGAVNAETGAGPTATGAAAEPNTVLVDGDPNKSETTAQEPTAS